MKMKFILVVLCCCLFGVAQAMDDTPENRLAQINRYLEVVKPAKVYDDVIDQLGRQLPEEQRAIYITEMKKHLDVNTLTEEMRKAMLKNFTADEANALADFYGSQAGSSAMAKMPMYMADIMPALQKQVAEAFAKTQQELSPGGEAAPQ